MGLMVSCGYWSSLIPPQILISLELNPHDPECMIQISIIQNMMDLATMQRWLHHAH